MVCLFLVDEIGGVVFESNSFNCEAPVCIVCSQREPLINADLNCCLKNQLEWEKRVSIQFVNSMEVIL